MSKLQKQAQYRKAESKADEFYNLFIEMIEQIYGVRKHGYQWENKKVLNKTDSNYIKETDKDIDNPIIQSSLNNAIALIGSAALSLKNYKGKKRLKYFKTAIAYYETVHAWEHAYHIAKVALIKSSDIEYFTSILMKYVGKKNYNHDVVVDLDTLCNKLNNI